MRPYCAWRGRLARVSSTFEDAGKTPAPRGRQRPSLRLCVSYVRNFWRGRRHIREYPAMLLTAAVPLFVLADPQSLLLACRLSSIEEVGPEIVDPVTGEITSPGSLLSKRLSLSLSINPRFRESALLPLSNRYTHFDTERARRRRNGPMSASPSWHSMRWHELALAA